MDCKEGTRRMAKQISNLLDQIDQASYHKPLAVFKGSSLGQHVRHILDFYTCISKGCANDLIDYSKRQRDARIEQDKNFAKAMLNNLSEEICGLDEAALIQVRADFSTETELDRPIVHSSIGREIMFAYDHALHHLAIIKIGIQTAFPNLDLEENLGVAPATVKYRAGGKASDQ